MAAMEGRLRVVFDPELDCLRGGLARDLRDDAQPEIDARGDASGGDQVAVSHHPGLLVGRPDERQEIRKGPMRRRPTAPEQTGGAQPDPSSPPPPDTSPLPSLFSHTPT